MTSNTLVGTLGYPGHVETFKSCIISPPQVHLQHLAEPPAQGNLQRAVSFKTPQGEVDNDGVDLTRGFSMETVFTNSFVLACYDASTLFDDCGVFWQTILLGKMREASIASVSPVPSFLGAGMHLDAIQAAANATAENVANTNTSADPPAGASQEGARRGTSGGVICVGGGDGTGGDGGGEDGGGGGGGLTRGLTFPPSCTIQTRAPGPLRDLRGEIFHFFLSYRVSSEGPMIEELYDTIRRLSTCEKKIPRGAKGKWPKFARAPAHEDKHVVKGFLDKRCLVDGKDWEAGFVLGLLHSLVFVPLISGAEKIDPVTGDPTYGGTLGDMISLDANDRVDNVLLEYILAWNWSRQEGTYIQSIFPVLIGEKQNDDTYTPFDWSIVAKLPQIPSYKTNARAADILSMLGVDNQLIEDMKRRSVKQAVELILKHQGMVNSDMSARNQIHDFWAHKILDVIINDISSLQSAPYEFAFERPGGIEVLMWLKEKGMLKFSRTFAKHDVDSLKRMSDLNDKDIKDIFFHNASGSCTLPKGQEAALRSAIADLRSLPKSKRYSERLFEYRDSSTALGTAVWTSNSAEIACGKGKVQFVFILLAAYFLKTTYDQFPDGMMTKWREKEFGVILWIKVVWYVPFWASNVLIFIKTAYEGRYREPCTARKTLEEHNGRWNILLIMGILAEIIQILSGQHMQGWTIRDTFSWGGLVAEALLYFPACIITWWTIRYRQELWIPAWTGIAAIMALVFAYIWRERPAFFSAVLLALMLLSSTFVYFLISKILTVSNAKTKIQAKFEQLNQEWQNLVRANETQIPMNVSGISNTVSFSTENSQVSRGSLQTLWDLTYAVERELRSQYLAERARVSLHMRQIQNRNKGYGRFAVHEAGHDMLGKFRQVSSDLDQLFEQASSLNSAVQDYIADLLIPLQSSSSSTSEFQRFPHLVNGPVKRPDRAIQKCVRSYRRDVGCLTDLVRCTIVVETADQLLDVFKMFLRMSVVGNATVERSHLLGVAVDNDSNNQTAPGILNRMVSDSQLDDQVFRITSVKNRFHQLSNSYDPATGYRDLSLNLEVGWSYDFDSAHPSFLPVYEWNKGVTEQQIIEVQVLLYFIHVLAFECDHVMFCLLLPTCSMK